MNVLFQRRGGGWYGTLIRLWTRSPYIHTELEFSNGERFTSLAGRGTGYNDSLVPADEGAWTRVPVDVTAPQEAAIRAFCHDELGCRYDWAGIALTQILGFGRQSRTKWFCSELCMAALQRVLPGFCSQAAHWVSPKRLYQILA
jgi:hypothetical protein